MGRKKKSESKLLTNFELEIMKALWDLGGGSVHDVLDALPESNSYAYTTVSTVLRLLEQKAFVRAEKQGRGHFYFPALEKTDYESVSLQNMIDNLFSGNPTALLKRLVSDKRISSDELSKLNDLIEGELND